MNVLDVSLKVDTWHGLLTLLTQHYVPATVDLVDHKVDLRNISLAVHSQHSRLTQLSMFVETLRKANNHIQ